LNLLKSYFSSCKNGKNPLKKTLVPTFGLQ
jgi:hypothetical protein